MPHSADPGPSTAYNIPRPGRINLCVRSSCSPLTLSTIEPALTNRKETKAERAQRVYEREARKERHRRNLISRANGYAVSPPRSRSRDESITPPRFKAKPNSEGKGSNENEAIHILDDDDGSEDEVQEMGYKWMGDLGRSAKRMRVEQERMEQLEQEELMAREGDPFTSYSYASTSGNDVHDTGYSQSIPSRYRPTSHLRRESAPGAGLPEIGSMTESEYASYIRQGFSRSHREAEAAESARRAEEKRKIELEREKERLKQEKKDRRKEKERQRAFREKYAHAQGPGAGASGPTRSGSDTGTDDGKGGRRTQGKRGDYDYQAFKRDRYITRWATLNLRPDPQADGTEIQEIEMKYTDIPWPSYCQTLEKEDIKIFLHDISQSQESGDLRKTLRETIRIYHPDKFLGRFLGRVREGDREKVKEGVERVSRAINDLMGDLGR